MAASGLYRAWLTICLALALSSGAVAQSSYPNRPVKILVGFTPGTAPDLAARILADRFSEVWGTPFVAANVSCSWRIMATDPVANAAGDSSLVINPSLYEALPFDPLKRREFVVVGCNQRTVAIVPPELPVKTVAEL